MALNIKNRETEELASEVALMTGETKTEAIRRSLLERRERLVRRGRARGCDERLLRFLEREVWPLVPEDERGRRLAREEEDALLGYGPEGL